MQNQAYFTFFLHFISGQKKLDLFARFRKYFVTIRFHTCSFLGAQKGAKVLEKLMQFNHSFASAKIDFLYIHSEVYKYCQNYPPIHMMKRRTNSILTFDGRKVQKYQMAQVYAPWHRNIRLQSPFLSGIQPVNKETNLV